MYTLVYLNGNLSRPDTLTFFLQSNVGNTPLLQIDCVTPFQGSAEEFGIMTCEYLNQINPMITVNQVEIKNASTEMTKTSQQVHFAVIQIIIDKKKATHGLYAQPKSLKGLKGFPHSLESPK